MAVLSAGGCWLPRGLTFGPTNGPEDFQELVFIIFSRRLYKGFFLFLDDLSVATGRPPPHPPGPSGAHDVVTRISETTEKERAACGLGRSASSDPSPYSHLVRLLVYLCLLFIGASGQDTSHMLDTQEFGCCSPARSMFGEVGFSSVRRLWNVQPTVRPKTRQGRQC